MPIPTRPGEIPLPSTWTISVKDAAKLLGVHPDTVYVWLSEHRIPGVKIRGRWLIPRNELLLFVSGRAGKLFRGRHPEEAAD